MSELKTKNELAFNDADQLFGKCILILIVSFLLSFVISQILQSRSYYIIYAASEVICIFLIVSIVLIIGSTYEKKLSINYLIWLGFIAIAIFNLFHLYYFLTNTRFNGVYTNISIRQSMLGKLCEVLVLIMLSSKIGMIELNKKLGFLLTIVFSVIISIIILYFPKALQMIKIEHILIYIRFIILLFAIISIYSLEKKQENKNIASYEYILMVLILLFCTQLSFILLRNININNSICVHILKIAYYYYLYKAVFVSAIAYKNRKTENENAQLKNLQFQTQIVLNAMEKLVLIVDKDGKIVMCNRAHEEILGIPVKQVIGMNYSEYMKKNKVFLEKEYKKNDSDSNLKRSYEITVTNIYGEKKRLLCDISTIYDANGKMVGKIGVASNMTNLREQQEKMIQQEKLALLGQMGASIVHETRNYLTTIKGSCQLIDILTQEEKVRNYTQKINKDINEVNRIISEFLSLSKPRELHLEEVSIYDMVQSIKSIVETSSLMKGVNISFYLSKDEEYLLCDESQIKQVVLNICKNAVDAMVNTEDARLIIGTGYDEKTNELFIRIEDNGQGMSKETLKKIGTPFFTTKKTGTGLGLNVCYTIVKEHKGRIEVESELGKGTTFKLILPCIEDEEEFEEMIP
ncbi:PAS domain-containing protein [Clostridium sp. PL3]|uniref:PAS domain-containing protein n=1 Tax=Clostridium thailandense TaxID=2794346 RepID=A0A949TGS4_9CLOT|nr:ATP-binding protein [Clostridium thailandense]MBV7272514.1 PAS domain-containing protein [Clostridium thailandense]